jgi:predicted small metal-binding protein
MKVRCPRKGCNYQTDANAAKDAMEDLQLHLKQVHGVDESPEEIRKSVEGPLKAESKKRI